MRNSVRTLDIVRYAFAAAMLSAAACNLKLGDAPIGPIVIGPGQQDTTVTLSISATPTQLVADGLDTATIEVTLRDNLGHAMTGEFIDFYTNNVGTVGSPGVIDQNGVCRVILTSAKVNDTCWVRAQARNWNIWDSVSVIFSGVHLSLVANPAALRVAVDTTLITGQLLDGSNRAISNGDSAIFLTRTGRFTNGDTILRTVFNASGLATARMYSNVFGTVMVYVSSAGINDSIAVNFNNTVPPVGSRLFTLYSSKTQLKADNNDMATIIAMVMDENHNPATGDIITFHCDLGMIGPSAVVDEYGNAVTWLRARPVNGTCIITAIDSTSGDTASTSVLFSGVTIHLESSATNLNLGETAVITATLKDGSGNAIGGDTVVFSTAAPGVFANGGVTARSFLDPTGLASVNFSSSSIGRVYVGASCLNTRDTIELFYTNNAITLTASRDTIVVGGADSSLLTATYLDGSGSPVSGAMVVFYANAGTIARDSVFTDGAGHASTWLRSADFTGTATIEAATTAGNALARVAFAAAKIKKIRLSITPDNISINGGVATLTATVWDVNDNLVNNADVNFLLLAGPGGGEYIDNPMATTQNGKATAKLYAGSVPSMYRSVMVTASVAETGDTGKLTISGEPYAISVSYPEEDTVTVPNAGQMNETTFDLFMGAVVCDINGNPVADGTRVNFSAVVSGMAVHRKNFVRWEGLDGTDPHPVYCYSILDIPFEDINNNLRMDENDLKLDYNDAVASRGDDVNGNGVCDFNPNSHDVWFDFDNDGEVDTGGYVKWYTLEDIPVLDSTPVYICKDTIFSFVKNDTLIVPPDTFLVPHSYDTVINICHWVWQYDTVSITKDTLWHDTTYNGSEPYIMVNGIMVWADLYPDGVWTSSELVRDVNHNGIFDVPASGDRLWWEYECLPYWFRERFDFKDNDFGIVINTSAVTVGGVADVELTYPRQLARRLFVSVNAESNGVRDRSGARFVLPVIGR
jgi:hypothetical protein